MNRRISLLVALAVGLALPGISFGHAERPTESPARPGAVPDAGRIAIQTPVLQVCKTFVGGLPECAYEDIQAAVAAAPDGALIKIYPGLYEELPSRDAPTLPPDNPDGTYSFQHHVDHPNSQNLIAVVGKRDITLLGMGRSPRDVVIDVEFRKHVGIRGDRADGLIVKNLSVWHAFDHGVYVLDTGGFLIDRVVSGFSREYAFLAFAVDHGLISNCEAIGAGDAGIYPGGTANTPGRHSVEIAACRSYHNVIGYSGTQGNYVWVHDSEFTDNAVGMTSDSETDHPNYPQQNLTLEGNRFHDNNFNVYAADSDVKATVLEGEVLLPVGTGVFLASGNDNLVQNNSFWGNSRYGFWLASGQGLVIGPTSDPPADPFLSSRNRFLNNRMYPPAGVAGGTNLIDFAWDGLGFDNCWQGNTRVAGLEFVTTDGAVLPACSGPLATTASAPNPVNMAAQVGLVALACRLPSCPWAPGPAPANARNLPSGYRVEWPPPPTCGPSTCPA